MARSNGRSEKSPAITSPVTTLSVAGFKSILDEQTIKVRPLTLLAGANSSGKSSMMQPLLLLKQTLEAPYDPGPLLLSGPNAKFTSVSQFWPSRLSQTEPMHFVIKVGASDKLNFAVAFRWYKNKFDVDCNTYTIGDYSNSIWKHSSIDDIVKRHLENLQDRLDLASLQLVHEQLKSSRPEIIRSRFFLEMAHFLKEPIPGNENFSTPSVLFPRSMAFEGLVHRIMEVVHLPGLRGNPERTYPVTAVGPNFPGTFESYVASLIAHWSSESPGKIKELGDDLNMLGLTWKIEAKRVDDTRVELHVGRMPRPKRGGSGDVVSVADVGFGVSQTLPVLVALRAARPGQLVYIEQPEIHLHPRAQAAMARLLVNAANRGVRLVVETHSSLLLLGLQTLVAEGEIEPDLVGLNWFLRSEKDGTTRIRSAQLDEAGRFGDWPEDFDEVALKTESHYLSAAEARLAGM
jgi:AAA domain, putative AbiEii toxin, Type IV TA system